MKYFQTQAEKAETIERWQQALRVMENMTEHERTKHFDMRDWGRRTDCGAIACLAGFCGLDPWFRERGLKFSPVENGETIYDMWFEDDVSPEQFFKDPCGGEQMFYYTDQNHAQMVVHLKKHIELLQRMPVAPLWPATL